MTDDPDPRHLDVAMRRLHERLREEMRSKWNRDLPFDELIFDRWERARSLGFGEGASIYHSSVVYGDVSVGEGTWIGPNTILDGSGGLRIGAGCDVSAGVQIYTHDTVLRVLSKGRHPIELSPVEIGNHCHIGANAVIRRGVTIGDHSVIGAAAFVNRDVPPYTIAVGVPCRRIGVIVVEDDDRITFRYDEP